MRKNKTMRAASLMLVLTLITTCFVGGTFAKYTSDATVSDEARVAKWSFTVGGADIAQDETVTFDLFKTVLDTDNSAEADISPADGTIIAPGTQGEFEIKLQNLSEVTAEYAIDYTVTNTANIPIEYSVDGTTWTNELADVTAGDATKLAVDSAEETITVQWRWAFFETDAADAVDTELGKAGTATLKVEAKITATQVD